MSDWYPRNLSDRIPWHANYNTNAQATGTTYGLSAGDKTDAGNDAGNVPLIVNFKQAVSDYAQAVTEWADLMFDAPIGSALPPIPTAPTAPTLAIGSKPSIVPRTRLQAGIIKADADYTQQVGENYGIVAPAAGAWSQIGVAQTAEFIDTTAPAVAGQPEQRDYRAQGMENNARVGALSAIVTAVTVP